MEREPTLKNEENNENEKPVEQQLKELKQFTETLEAKIISLEVSIQELHRNILNVLKGICDEVDASSKQ